MGLLDAISPTPRNRILGLLADATQGVNDFASKPFGYDNPPARMLMGLLGVPSIATTLDRLSYGEPLTNIGKANVPLLKPETADAAMAAAAALPAVSRGALKASDAAVRAITRNPEATATKVMDYAAQMNPANPMVVWHGSPHKFDKFDSSKIGTGEGAQAYGHGLYFAEHPDTAMTYQPRDSGLEQKIMQRYSAAERLQQYPAMQVYEDFLLHKTPQEVMDNILQSGYSAADLAQAKVAHKAASAQYFKQRSGALYKVDLPDSAIAKMLDWDAPLSKQAPEVRAALSAEFPPLTPMQERLAATGKYRSEALNQQSYPGSVLYGDLMQKFGGQGGVESELRRRGIPGIRYLDGGSRGAGAGTSNFVVFPGNEGLLSILERNGVPVK